MNLSNVLEALLNRYLRLDPDNLARAAALEGKIIGVYLRGPEQAFYFRPYADGVRVSADCEDSLDVLIRATPLDLLQLARGGDSRNIEIEGDAHVAKSLQDLLRGVDIDWEEELSHWLGDMPAHQIGVTVRGIRAWANNALSVFMNNTAEYLQYESRDLPPTAAVEEFLDEVDQLRSDIDRLQARIERLRRRLEDD